MWYDSFLYQLENFAGLFTGEEFYWGDLINGTTVSILLVLLYSLTFFIALLVNGTASSEIKMSKTFTRLKGFFARFGVIQKGNFVQFNKICISKMPAKVKKACVRFIFNPTLDNQSNLKLSLLDTSKKSCTSAFIAYIIIFGIGAILAVATITLETFYLENNGVGIAVSLFFGAVNLVILAVQMYYISNKYKNIDMQIYSDIVSRYVKEDNNNKILAKSQNKAENKGIDSIDELRRIVYGLIESGASKELLGLFKDGLLSVAATNYNSTADQMRLENIVTKINSYIA